MRRWGPPTLSALAEQAPLARPVFGPVNELRAQVIVFYQGTGERKMPVLVRPLHPVERAGYSIIRQGVYSFEHALHALRRRDELPHDHAAIVGVQMKGQSSYRNVWVYTQRHSFGHRALR